MLVPTRTLPALLVVALVAAGCGGGDDDETATAPTGSGVPVQTSDATATEPAESAPGPEPAKPGSAPKPSTEVLATRDGQIDEAPIRLELTELVRSGATASLTLRLTNPSGDGGDAQIANTLDDGISDDEAGNEYDTTDGISLIDPVNRKRYLVARDSSGRCVCDNALNGAFVQAESPTPTVLSATFAAPPAGVETVDIVVPRFGTFKNVPVS